MRPLTFALYVSMLCLSAHAADLLHYADTAGALPVPLAGRLDTTDPQDLLIRRQGVTIRIPYARISSLSYCRAADPVDPLDLAKSVKGGFHRLLTIGFRDRSGDLHHLVLQIPAKTEEATLRDIEEQTGFKIGSEPLPAGDR